jgi:hypothetical protein
MPSCAVQALSLRHAGELGYETARLPVSDLFPKRTSHILNINTVVELLMAWRVSIRVLACAIMAIVGMTLQLL